MRYCCDSFGGSAGVGIPCSICCGVSCADDVFIFLPSSFSVSLVLSSTPPPLLFVLTLSMRLLIGWDTAEPQGHELLDGCRLDTCSSVRLDYHSFVHALPMPDFRRELHVSTYDARCRLLMPLRLE